MRALARLALRTLGAHFTVYVYTRSPRHRDTTLTLTLPTVPLPLGHERRLPMPRPGLLQAEGGLRRDGRASEHLAMVRAYALRTAKPNTGHTAHRLCCRIRQATYRHMGPERPLYSRAPLPHVSTSATCEVQNQNYSETRKWSARAHNIRAVIHIFIRFSRRGVRGRLTVRLSVSLPARYPSSGP